MVIIRITYTDNTTEDMIPEAILFGNMADMLKWAIEKAPRTDIASVEFIAY